MFTGAELCTRLPPVRDPKGGLREDQANHVGTSEVPSPPGLPGPPLPSTDGAAAGVGHCAAIKSLLQGCYSKLV